VIYSIYVILTARLAGERRGETAVSRTGGTGAETRPAVAASLMISGTFAVVGSLALAMLLLGEALSPVQPVGGALVIGGVMLAQTTPGARPDVVVEEA
jgi:hypothetical protein